MASYNIENSKIKISDVNKKTEIKKGELANLEKDKQAVLDAGIAIQGSHLDEQVQKTVMDALNNALDSLSQKGKELSSEMNEDLSVLENIKQENQESMDSNMEERSNLEKTKTMLDMFGIGGNVEKGISELDNNQKDLNDVQQTIIAAQKEISNIASKLDIL